MYGRGRSQDVWKNIVESRCVKKLKKNKFPRTRSTRKCFTTWDLFLISPTTSLKKVDADLLLFLTKKKQKAKKSIKTNKLNVKVDLTNFKDSFIAVSLSLMSILQFNISTFSFDGRLIKGKFSFMVFVLSKPL